MWTQKKRLWTSNAGFRTNFRSLENFYKTQEIRKFNFL